MTTADYNLSTDQLRQGYSTIADQRQLFAERTNELVDYTPETQGIEAAFSMDDAARQALKKRAEARTALTAGAGEAAASEKGAAGLGAAR